MFNLLNFKSKVYRRFVYGLASMAVILGIGITTAQPSQAGIFDILLRGAVQGVRVYQLSNMTDEQEVDLGGGINAQLVNSGQAKLFQNASLTTYLNDIGQTLAAQSDRPEIPYTFQIVEDDAVNAFATMGGYVYITTGLMAAADNEAELAGVVGHEIGHIAGRHAVQQMRKAAITQGITNVLGVNRDRLVNIGTQVAIQLPASRSDEYEADVHGFESMGRAGYDQSGMVSFMQKLVRGRSQPEFLSTHPDARNRVTALQSRLDESASPQATFGLSEADYDARVSSLR